MAFADACQRSRKEQKLTSARRSHRTDRPPGTDIRRQWYKVAMGQRKHRPSADASASPSARSTQQALWLYGRHPVTAAVRNPRRRLERLVATGESAAVLEQAAANAPVARPRVETADRREIAALLPPDAVHQGFAALVRPLPACHLETVLASAPDTPSTVLVVLDQVTDPRNVGAVLRSAQAFDASAVLVQDRHAPEETAALAKAASGALESVPLVRVTNLAHALRTLKDAQFFCVGLAGDAPLILSKARLQGRLGLVLGAEGSGLRRLVRETCDVVVRIPIASTMESLNLSAAAAIALYECRRQTRAGPCESTAANAGDDAIAR
jgi:23S rRNA (guanosine2251-2'-O)-methyltransferase